VGKKQNKTKKEEEEQVRETKALFVFDVASKKILLRKIGYFSKKILFRKTGYFLLFVCYG
jgi:hypothetical protein